MSKFLDKNNYCCRHCGNELHVPFVDLGFAPPSNAYLTYDDLNKPETYFPLKVMVCSNCWLVQTIDYTSGDYLFDEDYAYFSSTSSSWLQHAREYVDHIIPLLNINKSSFVVEIASNDGYLLKNFVEKGINCLGIEPTKSTAEAARKIGINVVEEFFGEGLAEEISKKYGFADLIIGNNVYAHIPDINDFTFGIEKLLSEEGVVTLEFNHIVPLIENCQFDTIYHEHFEYHSLHSAKTIFEKAGLIIWDVEEISTHGGSLRIYGSKKSSNRKISKRVFDLIKKEKKIGIETKNYYSSFQERCDKIKSEFVNFLVNKKNSGKLIGSYGAAAKGNTLLNFSKVDHSLIPFVCDAAESKQDKFLPGSHIPVINPKELKHFSLDYLIIFPWNIANEIEKNVRPLIGKDTKIVTFIPELKIL